MLMKCKREMPPVLWLGIKRNIDFISTVFSSLLGDLERQLRPPSSTQPNLEDGHKMVMCRVVNFLEI